MIKAYISNQSMLLLVMDVNKRYPSPENVASRWNFSLSVSKSISTRFQACSNSTFWCSTFFSTVCILQAPLPDAADSSNEQAEYRSAKDVDSESTSPQRASSPKAMPSQQPHQDHGLNFAKTNMTSMARNRGAEQKKVGNERERSTGAPKSSLQRERKSKVSQVHNMQRKMVQESFARKGQTWQSLQGQTSNCDEFSSSWTGGQLPSAQTFRHFAGDNVSNGKKLEYTSSFQENVRKAGSLAHLHTGHLQDGRVGANSVPSLKVYEGGSQGGFISGGSRAVRVMADPARTAVFGQGQNLITRSSGELSQVIDAGSCS